MIVVIKALKFLTCSYTVSLFIIMDIMYNRQGFKIGHVCFIAQRKKAVHVH